MWFRNRQACANISGASSGPSAKPELPARAGPPVAPFEQLYERWYGEVARWIRSLGAREADRDDLVQEVFLLAFRRFESFDGENPAGWLYQITRRKVRDYRRLAWIKHFLTFENLSSFDPILQDPRTPLHDLETHQKLHVLNRVLDTLNIDQRAAFVLFEIEGQSGEEIARAQNAPLNTVWARIYKARQKLRDEVRRLGQ